MKLTFLGTAAYEGIPALCCNCAYCNQARQLGGKDIRTRSQTLINDDLLIDFPPDSYTHFLRNNIEGHKIRYLLVTHSHSDHLYPADLLARGSVYAHDMAVPTLQILGSEGTCRALSAVQNQLNNITFQPILPYETRQLGPYTVTALPAQHMEGDNPVFYIIKGEKTLLYAHDTGYFFEEVFDYIRDHKPVFDLVSLDCTYVDLPSPDNNHHMGFDRIAKVLARLEAMGAVTESTVKVANHFSHNGNPIHERITVCAAQAGCVPSYDGMTVEF